MVKNERLEVCWKSSEKVGLSEVTCRLLDCLARFGSMGSAMDAFCLHFGAST